MLHLLDYCIQAMLDSGVQSEALYFEFQKNKTIHFIFATSNELSLCIAI
jgi:hypothetical protein